MENNNDNNDENLQKKFGFLGKTIRPPDNRDIYDTLTPLWVFFKNDDKYPIEKRLAYICAMLTDQLYDTRCKLFDLQMQFEEYKKKSCEDAK